MRATTSEARMSSHDTRYFAPPVLAAVSKYLCNTFDTGCRINATSNRCREQRSLVAQGRRFPSQRTLLQLSSIQCDNPYATLNDSNLECKEEETIPWESFAVERMKFSSNCAKQVACPPSTYTTSVFSSMLLRLAQQKLSSIHTWFQP